MKILNFIILILTLISVKICIPERNYNLHKQDTLSIQISDILSYSDLTNNLKTSSKDLEVLIPPIYKKVDISMTWEIEGKIEDKPGFKIEKIYDQTNYGDFFISLVKTDQVDNLLIISEVKKNGQELSINSKISKIASDELQCNNVVMETEKVYTGCISESENYFYICEKYYKDDTKPLCEFYDFNYTFKKGELKDELVKLNLFIGNSNEVIIVMYLKHSKIGYFEDKFLLKINEKSSFLSLPLENGFNIKKIKIINYLVKTNEVNCLISGEVKIPKFHNQLYHMKIIGGIIDKEFLKSSLINNTLKSFDQFNSDILIYEEIQIEDINHIRITEMNLENLSKKYFDIKNQYKLIRADLGFNKAVIETLDDKNQNNLYFYDTNTKRLTKSDINLSENKRWSIMSLLNNNFFFIFNSVEIEGEAYFLNSQRTIDIINNKGFDKGDVEIIYDGKSVFSIHINYQDFNQALNNVKSQLQCIEGRSNNVKIDYYTNDMKINNRNINYFSKMNIKGDLASIEKCNPTRVFFNQDLFIYFCWDKRILNFKSVEYKENDLILGQAVFYKSDLLFDFDLIKSVKLYYGKILLILMDDMSIIWTNMNSNFVNLNLLEFQQFDYLTESYTDCSWNNQGLICIKENNYEQLSLEIRDSLIEINLMSKKPVDQIKLKNNYFNSFYDRYYKLSLEKDKFYEKEIFQGCKVHCNLSVDTQIDLNEDTLTYMVTHKNFVLINHDEKKNLILHGIINGSIIKYPTENYLKEYKEIILFNNSLYTNLFVVFYKTVRNTIRALLYKGSLEVSQRLIQEFLVDEEDCNEPKTYSQITNSNSFIIYYSCEDDLDRNYVWKFKMDGPLYKSIGNETEDTLVINGKEINLNFFYFNKKNDFDVTSTDIKLNGSTNGEILKDLEEEGNVTITGDVINCKIKDINTSGVEIIQRTHINDQFFIPIYEEKIKEYENLNSLFHNDSFILNLGNFLLVDKQLKNTSNYKECIFVKTTFNNSNKHFSQIYLCRGELSLHYYLTDLDKLDILIDPQYLESNLKVFKAYLVRLKNDNEMYLVTSVDKNHKILNVIKINETGKKSGNDIPFEVINSNFLYVDNYYDMITSFSNFFITYDKENLEIVIFLHPQYSSRLLILNLPLNEDKINLKSRNIVELNYGKQLEIFKTEFFDLIDETNKTRIGVLFTTNYHLYEVHLEKNNDSENWKYTVINEWYNQSGNSKEFDIINFNDHFVSLTLRMGVDNINTLFWKRKVDERKFIHSSIGKNELGTNEYKIADVNMISIDEKHYTYVTYYYNKINNNEWKDLRMKIFESKNLQIKLNLDKLKYKEVVNLKFTSIASENRDIFIELTLEENFKIFIFTLSLIILLIIMTLLIIFVIVLYNGNKKLKADLERDLRENNMTNNLA